MKQKAVYFAAFVVLGAGVLAAALFVPNMIKDRGAHSELQSQRKIWAESGATNYAYTAKRSCLCEGPLEWRIEVRDGEVVSSEATMPVVQSDFNNAPDFLVGDDALFDLAVSVIGAEEYRIVYDPELGLPVDIYGDPSLGTEDDQLSISLSDIEVVGLS